MEDVRTDPAVWLSAARRAADFLTARWLPSGAIQEHVGNSRLSPRQAMARLGNLFDVWHTVSALVTLDALGATAEPAAHFVASQVLEGGGLSHCSTRPGLCIETTAAAALILPDLRTALLETLRRHALPGGR